MGKPPAFQFYTKDWLCDPHLAMASYSTKGIWIDLLCYMWENESKGIIKGKICEIQKMLRATEMELELFLKEALQLKFANVTCNGDVTNCNSEVTIINRRMERNQKERENTRLRVASHRERQKVTDRVTVPSSSSSSSSTSKRRKIYIVSFQKFWEIYPNHSSGKQAAFKSWCKIKPTAPLVDKIIQSIQDHKQNSPEWKKGYIPHATTWLNQGRWTAEFGGDDEF